MYQYRIETIYMGHILIFWGKNLAVCVYVCMCMCMCTCVCVCVCVCIHVWACKVCARYCSLTRYYIIYGVALD